jgi:hypothetical protein
MRLPTDPIRSAAVGKILLVAIAVPLVLLILILKAIF